MSRTTRLCQGLCVALLSAGQAFASALSQPPSLAFPPSDSLYRQGMSYFFDRPARDMMEELPLGNGRLGLLSDGGIQEQVLTLCESSMWSGSEDETAWATDARQHLPTIQALLLAGKAKQAEELMYRTFVCGGQGSGRGQGADTPYGSYQVGGFLRLQWGQAPFPSKYRRSLSLLEGVSEERFEVGAQPYRSKRLYSVFGGDVQVVKLTNHRLEAQRDTLRLQLSRPACSQTSAGAGYLTLTGQLPNGQGGKGLRYAIVVRPVLPEGGELLSRGKELLIVHAPSVVLYIAHNTNYYDPHAPLIARGVEQILAVEPRGEDALYQEHRLRFSQRMERVRCQLFGGDSTRSSLPIDRRLSVYHRDPASDPALVALYLQLGRYLLLSSTRPGALPPNLQGLWTATTQAPWNADYHLNINLQMNYWPADKGALGELLLPLTRWIEDLVPSGQRTARTFYGASGWVTHILGNLWRFTAPGEHPSWGATNTSAAWLCQHLYNHYRYTQDRAYLARIYPLLVGATRFFTSTLLEDPKTGYLVNVPTTSPENSYYTPEGEEVAVVAGSTMDSQILRELFANTQQAARLLGRDRPLLDSLSLFLQRLPPTRIAPDGRLMEWMEDYREVDPHHRHVSHLYGLYPGAEITPEGTPELADAARKTLLARGSSSTSWSMGWKVNFYARLGDAPRAYEVLNMLLRPVDALDQHTGKPYGSGTNPNLFSSHPPFQIDGNFGGASGVMEMLLRSETGVIVPLPALPEVWREGYIQGLRVIGNARCSLRWQQGRLQYLLLEAQSPYEHVLLLPEEARDYRLRLNGRPLSTKTLLRAGRLHLPLLRAGDRVEVFYGG